jgi:hypothetical protein
VSVLLSQIFELQGEWWLPENPSQKVKGALRFTPKEGGILRLDVFPSGSVEIEHFQQPQIILGVSISPTIAASIQPPGQLLSSASVCSLR